MLHANCWFLGPNPTYGSQVNKTTALPFVYPRPHDPLHSKFLDPITITLFAFYYLLKGITQPLGTPVISYFLALVLMVSPVLRLRGLTIGLSVVFAYWYCVSNVIIPCCACCLGRVLINIRISQRIISFEMKRNDGINSTKEVVIAVAT